jgi:hypothetical protein
MKGLEQYWVQYSIVQVVSLVFLYAAYKNTRLARLLFALLFLYAAGYNMYTGLTAPDVYLGYAGMALPFYRDFINGWFSRHNDIVIPLIACGQFIIGAGMLLKGWWVKWASIGAIVFLICITPLMVGAGFPFTLIVSWAAALVLKKDNRNYLWTLDQHTGKRIIHRHYKTHSHA